MKKICFSYSGSRCWAEVVSALGGNCEKVGRLRNYTIYQVKRGILFDQFGFIAVKEK